MQYVRTRVRTHVQHYHIISKTVYVYRTKMVHTLAMSYLFFGSYHGTIGTLRLGVLVFQVVFWDNVIFVHVYPR